MGAPNLLQLWGTFPIFLPQDTSLPTCLLGVSQAVFAIKGPALAPGGSSSCLSTARSWGRFGTPDENGKAKATFQKLRGTHLWGEKLSPSKGASSVQPEIWVPKSPATS